MEWTEIAVKTNEKYAEDASAVLQMVSSGIYIEDYRNLEQSIMEIAHIDLIDEALLKKDRENVIIHAYFAEIELDEISGYIKERLEALSIPYELCVTKIEDTDWAENWKKYYKPFAVGERLMIKPEWEECEPEGRAVLRIEPGLAFGTGTHETTKMCLELLEEYAIDGNSVLDVGCGSGILSIASLLLGASTATAIDIDPIAVKTARENGALNGFCEDRLKVLEGDLTSCLSGEKYDVIFANIIADAIIKLAPLIGEYMNEECVFICSGIIESKLDAVIKSVKENGLAIDKTRLENGWAAVSAVCVNA